MSLYPLYVSSIKDIMKENWRIINDILLAGSKMKGVVRTHLFTKEIQKPIGGGNILDKRNGQEKGGGTISLKFTFPLLKLITPLGKSKHK